MEPIHMQNKTKAAVPTTNENSCSVHGMKVLQQYSSKRTNKNRNRKRILRMIRCLILMCLRRWLPPRALARPYNSPVGSPRPIFSLQCKVIARTDVVSSSSSLAASTLLPLSPVCHRPAHTPSHQFTQAHRNDRRERRSLKTMNYEIRQNKIAVQRFKIFS